MKRKVILGALVLALLLTLVPAVALAEETFSRQRSSCLYFPNAESNRFKKTTDTTVVNSWNNNYRCKIFLSVLR